MPGCPNASIGRKGDHRSNVSVTWPPATGLAGAAGRQAWGASFTPTPQKCECRWIWKESWMPSRVAKRKARRC